MVYAVLTLVPSYYNSNIHDIIKNFISPIVLIVMLFIGVRKVFIEHDEDSSLYYWIIFPVVALAILFIGIRINY
jgi:Mg2+/citrate symporter